MEPFETTEKNEKKEGLSNFNKSELILATALFIASLTSKDVKVAEVYQEPTPIIEPFRSYGPCPFRSYGPYLSEEEGEKSQFSSHSPVCYDLEVGDDTSVESIEEESKFDFSVLVMSNWETYKMKLEDVELMEKGYVVKTVADKTDLYLIPLHESNFIHKKYNDNRPVIKISVPHSMSYEIVEKHTLLGENGEEVTLGLIANGYKSEQGLVIVMSARDKFGTEKMFVEKEDYVDLASLGGCFQGREADKNKEYNVKNEAIKSSLSLPTEDVNKEEEDDSLFVFDNTISPEAKLLQQEERLFENIEKDITSEEETISPNIVEEKDKVKLEYNEEAEKIFELIPDLFFDVNGNLFLQDNVVGDISSVPIIETDRHLTFPYKPVEEVKFFVIHYDGGPLLLSSGRYRTVLNILNGLNREGKPSVQFCVDPYPVNSNLEGKNGLGVILSQRPNQVPYKGRHVQIGINLETGAEDVNRVKTARLYEEVGVGSDFVEFVNSGERNFDAFSLGVEQIGTNYSINFPEQFPPRQQIANMIALSRAVSERYGLSVWDIVGHGEIQEKSDPGDEYMLTLRFYLGLLYTKENEGFPTDFLESGTSYEFFTKLKDYSLKKMGESRYKDWNEIYGMDDVIEGLGGSDSSLGL